MGKKNCRIKIEKQMKRNAQLTLFFVPLASSLPSFSERLIHKIDFYLICVCYECAMHARVCLCVHRSKMPKSTNFYV